MVDDSSASSLTGRRLGTYQIQACMGAGGMGVVYRALDANLNRPVAIKFLSDDLADPAARRRFQREAQTASSLNHPHILTVHDAGEFEGRQYLVTVTSDNATRTVTETRTRPGIIVGTVAYMSPEQASGRSLDARSDIFSFGVVLYEALSGERPFTGASDLDILHAVVHRAAEPLPEAVPLPLRMVVEKALDKDPADRFQVLLVETGNGVHTWRQRFPDGTPEQVTFGVTEEEGIHSSSIPIKIIRFSDGDPDADCRPRGLSADHDQRSRRRRARNDAARPR